MVIYIKFKWLNYKIKSFIYLNSNLEEYKPKLLNKCTQTNNTFKYCIKH